MDKGKIIAVFNIVQQAKSLMIETINEAIKDNGGEIKWYEKNGEERFIKPNENGNIAMFDDFYNELVLIEDLSIDELYDICKTFLI